MGKEEDTDPGNSEQSTEHDNGGSLMSFSLSK